jgi:nucleoside-diphosphate-sugar epimerase
VRVAVTGASGFVGSAVCREAAARGWEVYAFGRRGVVDPTRLAGAAYRSWDITTEPLAGPPEVEAVVHCGGSVTDWGKPDEVWAANLRGTQQVLDSFPRARFVHVSTASVYDPFRPTVMAGEDAAPVARYDSPYGASKAEAERIVLAAMEAGRPAIILRPHAVYGPGDTTLLPRIMSAVRGPWLVAVGTGRQRISLTWVGNLTWACLEAASGTLERGIFNITDAEPLSLDEALRAALEALGIRARPAYVPAWLARPLAALAEAGFRLAHRSEPPPLTRYAVRHLSVERTLNISAARARLGYNPSPTSFADKLVR